MSGPICCDGDQCCGPGSYCCGHPDRKGMHDHLEEDVMKPVMAVLISQEESPLPIPTIRDAKSYDGTIDLDRARQVGRMLADIDSTMTHAKTAYTNQDMHNGQRKFWESNLFRELGKQRTRLREELRKMG